MNDPIVEEIRKHRDDHARQFDYDLKKICQDFRKKHTSYVNLLKDKKRTKK